MKPCYGCDVSKPLECFNKHKGMKDGHLNLCKACCYKHKARKAIQAWKARNTEKVRAQSAAYREANKEKRSAYNKKWARENPGKSTAKTRRYQTRKLNRTPAWADQEAITAFYEARPEGYHVDHVLPLNGKTISGLHVLANLQYLPANENIRKGNRLYGNL